MTREKEIDIWQSSLEGRSPEEILLWAWQSFQPRIAFASSLGLEDQVLTDMIARSIPKLPIFTLDTGRLFQESYDLLERTESHYGLKIRVCQPLGPEVEEMVNQHGVNLFRQSVELRKHCCFIRKVQPLTRALSGLEAWICGLRRGQADSRSGLQFVEWDESNRLIKISPLADWNDTDVKSYVGSRNVPYNPLHDQGFPSIGCACCTRAVQKGEDIRAGRWWWESSEHKECGLHWKEGRLVAAAPASGIPAEGETSS
ncbi:MAG TPA: phosphoadenylyl-sulfate reductase [Terriglobia bacterium]|nr:phosphoadenylyl-sulfate reductase [Terriglobia bacterium]